MQGYKLFLYEVTKNKGLQSLENRTYDFTVLETNLTGLKTYTKYRIEVLGFNCFGNGPAAAVEVFTEEGSKLTHLFIEFISFQRNLFFSLFLPL